MRELLADITAAEPMLQPLLEKQQHENAELLAHVLFGDITRWVTSHPVNPKLLSALERHLTEGDASVRDLLLASFIENLLGEPIEHLRGSLGPQLTRAFGGRDLASRSAHLTIVEPVERAMEAAAAPPHLMNSLAG